LIHFYKRERIVPTREMGTPVVQVVLLGHLVLAGSLSVGGEVQPQHLVFAPLEPDPNNLFIHQDDRVGPEEKRGGGSWKMRMFKRGDDEEDESLAAAAEKRGWQMRMFKKADDHWRMRMFKRRFVLPDLQEDKRAEGRWKMRMFKRLEAAQHFGKRPDRWQMRMFKREPEMNQEYQGSPLR